MHTDMLLDNSLEITKTILLDKSVGLPENFRENEKPLAYQISNNVQIQYYQRVNIIDFLISKNLAAAALSEKQVKYIKEKIKIFGFRWRNIIRHGCRDNIFNKKFTAEELEKEYLKTYKNSFFRISFSLEKLNFKLAK